MLDNAVKDLDSETRLVLSLCLRPLTQSSAAGIRTVLAGKLDWARVFRLAATWQMEAVVLSNLMDHADLVPADVASAISKRAFEVRTESLAKTMRLLDVIKSLCDAGIDSIVLKGPAIAIEGYDDASLRSFADGDLLIRRHDMERARKVLEAKRFSPDYRMESEASLIANQHALELSSPSFKVELHAALLSRYLSLEIDPDEFWQGAKPVACAGEAMMIPSLPQHFFFLCAHGAKHQWMHVRWIADIAQLSRKLEPAEAAAIEELARRTHGRRILALALQVAREFFQFAESPFHSEWFVEDPSLCELKKEVATRFAGGTYAPVRLPFGIPNRNPRLMQTAFWIAARERPVDRLSCILRLITMDTASDARPRLVRWGARSARLAARLIRGTA
jgi:hypothetical protein